MDFRAQQTKEYDDMARNDSEKSLKSDFFKSLHFSENKNLLDDMVSVATEDIDDQVSSVSLTHK